MKDSLLNSTSYIMNEVGGKQMRRSGDIVEVSGVGDLQHSLDL